MSDGFDDENIDEVLDAIRALSERLNRLERQVRQLEEAAIDNDLLDLDEDQYDSEGAPL